MGGGMKSWDWEVIRGFNGWDEFDSFKAWIESQVVAETASETRVLTRYGGMEMGEERWYIRRSDGNVWRLVWPDPPFPGVFKPVEDREE